MVFWSSFAKKVKQSVSQISFDLLKNRVSQIENKYVKKDESNTLTQTNTFNGITNFKSRIEFRNQNNNGAYLDNFEFGNQNYTSFKLVKGSSNMLQIEVNNDANTATISSPNTNNGLHIYNLSNPVNPDNATNKGYVDGLYNPLNTKVDSVITGLQNGNIINYEGNYSSTKTYHLAQAVTYNGDWFVSNIDNNVGNTPTKSNTNYWVYISQPNVDLNLYLTKSQAQSTYAAQNDVNQFESNTTRLLNNLNTSKADLSYLNNNFYNKTYYDGRRVKYRDITITNVIRNKNLIPGELWIAQFETNFQPTNYDYLLNNMVFYDILFLHAQYTNWKYKITASYISGSPAKLAIEMLYTEENTVKVQAGQIVRVWYCEEINR